MIQFIDIREYGVEKLKKAQLIFVLIEYGYGEDITHKVYASGWWGKLLECFVFHHKADIFYYYPDTDELYHCYDLWYLYKIQEIGRCSKINRFMIKVWKVI